MRSIQKKCSMMLKCCWIFFFSIFAILNVVLLWSNFQVSASCQEKSENFKFFFCAIQRNKKNFCALIEDARKIESNNEYFLCFYAIVSLQEVQLIKFCLLTFTTRFNSSIQFHVSYIFLFWIEEWFHHKLSTIWEHKICRIKFRFCCLPEKI